MMQNLFFYVSDLLQSNFYKCDYGPSSTFIYVGSNISYEDNYGVNKKKKKNTSIVEYMRQ